MTTYTRSNAAISDFDGEEIAGDWNLIICDHAGRDVGWLNSWELELRFKPSDQKVHAEAQPNPAIPDATPPGIASTLEITTNGKLKNIRVNVEIAHTYIGDLYVELVAPSDHSASLHNRTGGGRDDLRVSFDESLAPALEVFKDEQIQGSRVLRVHDLVGYDTGTLERWSMDITYGS